MTVAPQDADHRSLLAGILRPPSVDIVLRLILAPSQVNACLLQMFRKWIDTRTVIVRDQFFQLLPSGGPQNCREPVTVRRAVAEDGDAAGDAGEQSEADG